eukprot:scaffold63871_cov21-Tisochrysis_lutea.AAC.2
MSESIPLICPALLEGQENWNSDTELRCYRRTMACTATASTTVISNMLRGQSSLDAKVWALSYDTEFRRCRQSPAAGYVNIERAAACLPTPSGMSEILGTSSSHSQQPLLFLHFP